MKYKIITRVAFLVAAIVLFPTCEKTAMEKAQDAYDASMVIPVVLGTTGASQVLQTFTYDYSPNYYRSGSTWSWSAVDATVKTVSADTRTASVLFDKLPATGFAYVRVTETTPGGKTSPVKEIKVKVDPFCPLANGVANLVGSWSGNDGGGGGESYPSIITTAVNGTKLNVTGMSNGFMNGFWGEPVIAGGTFAMTINNNGTLTIPRQYIFTTVYKGVNYEYEVAGSGTWDNCGTKPKMVIKYDIYYPGDAKGIAATNPSYLGNIAFLTANITLN
jgi:hypothetical protein